MRNYPKLLILLLCFSYSINALNACSGYKVTLGNKTIFGSNEDAWRLTPRLWFETASALNKYGAAFTGSRFDGENGFAPQTGMNEMGLAFERLASFHPKLEKKSGEKEITNPTIYLKNILHSCKNVEEVKAFIENYDYSFFIEDIFLYADNSGKYLVVEPYSIKIGSDDKYVISNFCPSITSQEKANSLVRYKNGHSFLSSKIDTSLAFCKALSDTMHVCRNKMGDGTLLTSIWDLQSGNFNLFFYHDYSNTISFNLVEELKNGNRIVAIDTLFPKNIEFEKLASFQIPKNNIIQAVFILFCAALFLFSFIYFLIQLIKKNQLTITEKTMIPLCLFLCYYMYVLSGSIHVFYFDAPYFDPSNIFVSISSYLPFLVLILFFPITLWSFKIMKDKNKTVFFKLIYVANNLAYIGLMGLFYYWGFYVIV
jgi:hypothetical protein